MARGRGARGDASSGNEERSGSNTCPWVTPTLESRQRGEAERTGRNSAQETTMKLEWQDPAQSAAKRTGSRVRPGSSQVRSEGTVKHAAFNSLSK